MDNWMDDAVLKRLQDVIPEACQRAGRSLSEMADHPVEVVESRIEVMRVEDLPRALQMEPDQDMVAATIGIEGQQGSIIALLFTPLAAVNLSALLLGTDAPATLDEMARSALGEIANITGASFLNVVAEALGERMLPTTPAVLEGRLAEILGAREDDPHSTGSFLVRTVFSFRGASIEGALVMLPSR